ncbi:peptidoglycan editing factor PgeF [Gottfriedia solisilvae]|uniref:Purine nucleoside phosphorylase n=1 Tax=Gottfriedia solisilvae TaxID=1516104 RepID=A0A8J3AP97_9BACI|nr:peptidoglycan editing factor PgeF [Gottfriedia solisilvae]GGI14402.1 laccase domain protein [Gottfriedia solisilvae]
MKECFIQSTESTFKIQPWEDSYKHLVAGFTTKNGGVSQGCFSSFNVGLHVNDSDNHVVKNRELLAKEINYPITKWVCSEQVHGNNVVKVTKDDRGKGVTDYNSGIPGTDGFYTNEENVLLTSCYADCVPLYFLEPTKKYIGLAHAGWKGTVGNIGGILINKWLTEENMNVENIQVVIGPSIGNCCYEVDDFVMNKVQDAFSNNLPPFILTDLPNGKYSLDLKEANKQLLIQAGIPKENILVTSYCTSCNPNTFFSHRRDEGKTGRMMSFIGWRI